jgi:hypothetical protein
MAKEFMCIAIIQLHDLRTLSLEVQEYCHGSVCVIQCPRSR